MCHIFTDYYSGKQHGHIGRLPFVYYELQVMLQSASSTLL